MSRDYQKDLPTSLKILYVKFQLKIFSLKVCRFAESKQRIAFSLGTVHKNSMGFTTFEVYNSTTNVLIHLKFEEFVDLYMKNFFPNFQSNPLFRFHLRGLGMLNVSLVPRTPFEINA